MQKLFDDLMKICEDSECFYYSDIISSMQTECRLFGYRFIPAYSLWLQDSATEMRGILFEMENGNPVKILARPMEKFFNINENEFTQESNLDLENAKVFEKADGSLVSIYYDKVLTTKTIKSLFSDQAMAANRLLHSDKYNAFYDVCLDYAKDGYTINCEYVAPDNQIVLYYTEPELKILNIRHNETGEYVNSNELQVIFGDSYLKPLNKIYSKDMYDEIGIEGYVLQLPSGQRVKLKTSWYLNLHRMKDGINSDSRIIEQIIDGNIDDVIPLLNDSPMIKRKIEIMSNFVSKKLFEYYTEVFDYYALNKYKTRKQYAMGFKGDSYLMNPAMKLYTDNDPDSVIEFLKQHIKKYSNLYIDQINKSGILDELKSSIYGNGQ